MYRIQINATTPIQAGSGTIEVQLPYVPHVGDFIAMGPNQQRFEVVAATFIVHDEFHPKKEFCDVVVDVKLVK